MFYKPTPPAYFIYSNLTEYQQITINEKWYIYNYVEESKESKQQCFRELSAELGKGNQAIQKIYYSIK